MCLGCNSQGAALWVDNQRDVKTDQVFWPIDNHLLSSALRRLGPERTAWDVVRAEEDSGSYRETWLLVAV